MNPLKVKAYIGNRLSGVCDTVYVVNESGELETLKSLNARLEQEEEREWMIDQAHSNERRTLESTYGEQE